MALSERSIKRNTGKGEGHLPEVEALFVLMQVLVAFARVEVVERLDAMFVQEVSS